MSTLLEKAWRLILSAKRETNAHEKHRLRKIGGILHKQSKTQDATNIIFFDDAKARREDRRFRRSDRNAG